MNKLVLGILTSFAFAMHATGANACRMAPQPADPIDQDFDATALATVTSTKDGVAQISIGKVLRGDVPKDETRLVFDYEAARKASDNSVIVTSCGRRGPELAKGERIVIYLKNGTIGRWAHATEMVERDPHIEAIFLNATSEASRRSKRELSRRADEVAIFKGPVPVTDPTQWVKPFNGSLGWDPSSQNSTRFEFDVENDGRIGNCRQRGGMRKSSEVANEICRMLTESASFKPPRLSQEKAGVFAVRWPIEGKIDPSGTRGQK